MSDGSRLSLCASAASLDDHFDRSCCASAAAATRGRSTPTRYASGATGEAERGSGSEAGGGDPSRSLGTTTRRDEFAQRFRSSLSLLASLIEPKPRVDDQLLPPGEIGFDERAHTLRRSGDELCALAL